MGSSYDGEALGAARTAHAIVTHSGMSWQQLLGADSPPAPQHDAPRDTHSLVISCLDHPGMLTSWEISFCHSLRGFTEPSPKQRAILDRIAQKCGVHG
jgi:hypothetical protein